MQLDLIHAQHSRLTLTLFRLHLFNVLLQLLQVMHTIITHANTPYLTLGHRLRQRLPRAEPTGLTTIRRMQQVEIDIAEPRLAQRLVDGGARALVAHVLGEHLGGEEELGARDGRAGGVARGLERRRRRRLVAVHRRAVHVPVAGPHRVRHHVRRDGGWRLEDAESEDRDRVAGPQRLRRGDVERRHCGWFGGGLALSCLV